MDSPSAHTFDETGPPINVFNVAFTPEEITLCRDYLEYTDLFEQFFANGFLDNQTLWLLRNQLRTLANKADTDENARRILAIMARNGITLD